MRKNVITIVVFALLLFEGRARVANADDIIMGSGDWCPYVCDPSIHDGANGYLADIAKIIFEDAGHSFTIKYMPFARALSFAREGKITGIPGIYMGDAPALIFP
jgi:polar amino acid transport system substrate-binding protein